MAGKRSGVLDPLAERAGVAQKCVVPVGGMPMIERVVMNVAASPRIGEIRVAHEADEIAAIPSIASSGRGPAGVQARPSSGRQRLCRGRGRGLSAADHHRGQLPVAAEDFTEFADKAIASKAGLQLHWRIRKTSVPRSRVAVLVTDGGYSNCNAYWIGPRRHSAAEIMRGGERSANSRPDCQGVRRDQPDPLLPRRSSKEQLFAQVSRRSGSRWCRSDEP